LKEPPVQNPDLVTGRPWFLPPKVDLVGGWDVVGTGKGVKMGVVRNCCGPGRVPRALVPGNRVDGGISIGGRGGVKCRCGCREGQGLTGSLPLGHLGGGAGAGRRRGLLGPVRRGNGRGVGFIRIDGLGVDGVGEGGGTRVSEGRCCDCGCGCGYYGGADAGVGGNGLRVKAIENGMRMHMRKVRVMQKEGEVADLESPMGSFEDDTATETTSGDGSARRDESEWWNDSDETLVPRPLSFGINGQRRVGFEGDEESETSSLQEADGEDPSSIVVASKDQDTDATLSELDLRLSSLLSLIHYAGTLLHKHKALNRVRNLLRELTGMAIHIFQTAVQVHDLLLLPRYHPQGRKGRKEKGAKDGKADKGDKEMQRLQIVKLMRDCAVAGGELLVLLGVVVLVGRVGMTVMVCARWVRWVGSWVGWVLRGLFWG